MILTNCKKEKIVSSTLPIEIDIDYKKELDIKESLTSYFFKHRKIVQLQTTEKSLISNINRIIIFNNRYYIFDHKSKSICIFDSKGKFIKRIKRVGKGPGEYIQITDFTIKPDKRQIILLCDIPNSFIFLDLDGNFIKQINKKEYDQYICADSTSIYLATSKTNSHKMHIKTQNQNTTSFSLNFEKYFFDKVFYGFHPNIILSKDIYYHKVYDNTIYQLTKDSVIPKYKFHFDDRFIDRDFVRNHSLDEILMMPDNSKIFMISDFRETNNYLIFRYYPDGIVVIYNKALKTHSLISTFYDKQTGLYLRNLMGYDGYGNDMMFILSASNFKNYVLSKTDTTESLVYEEYKKIATKLTENDNPVLMLYTLK